MTAAVGSRVESEGSGAGEYSVYQIWMADLFPGCVFVSREALQALEASLLQ